MALKAVQVSGVPRLDNVTEIRGVMCKTGYATTLLDQLREESEKRQSVWKPCPKFMVIGHRGSGMNKAVSSDGMEAIRENTIMSFNAAAKNGVGFIEFDVQVTRDGHAVIFHDDIIITNENGKVVEKRIAELTLEEFLSYGFQKDGNKIEKSLLRRAEDGKIFEWNASLDDCLCTLRDAFQNVVPSVGFNIELKFEDEAQYSEDQLMKALQVILKDVNENAKGRQIFFSSFHPDAARLLRREQDNFPVLFLTKGGTKMYKDSRRNSLEAAVQVCIQGGLQGIVSEVKAILKNPEAIAMIKEEKLYLLTYGELNNSAEAVYIQRLIGVDGVIVDRRREIAASVAEFTGKSISSAVQIEDERQIVTTNPQQMETQRFNSLPEFSQEELSFVLKLTSRLMQS